MMDENSESDRKKKEERVDTEQFHYKLPAALWENKEVLTQQRPFQSPSLTPVHLQTLTVWNTFFTGCYHHPASKNNIFSVSGRSWQTSLCFKHWIRLERLRNGDSFYTAFGYFLTIQFISGHNMTYSTSKERVFVQLLLLLASLGSLWIKGCSSSCIPQIDFFLLITSNAFRLSRTVCTN